MYEHKTLLHFKTIQWMHIPLFFLLLINIGNAQHITDFTSIPDAPRTPDFKIPNTHDFQYLTYETQNGALGNFDFTAYVPTAGSSSSGHLSINHELTAGGVSVYDIVQNQNTKTWTLSNKINVRYGQVNRPCSGLVTSWGAVLACEESNNGRVLEVNPVNGTSIWRHQLGRLGHENVAEHRTNQRTFYTGEDTGAPDDVLLKFVADSPADLSSGSLYTLQRNGTTGTWLPIPNTSTTDTDDVALAAGASGFAGIEDVEIHPLTGQVYFSVKNENRVYRFTEGSDLGAGGVTNFEVFAQSGPSYNINGADNMAFDELGNLYVLQDRSTSNNNIYVFENGHTLQNPQVKIFGRAPSNAEPTGITFTPDFKYMFLSMQGPSGNNSLAQPDFFNNTVPNNLDFAIVVARNEVWNGQSCVAGTPINLDQFDFLVCDDTTVTGTELSGVTYSSNAQKFYAVGDEGTLFEFDDNGNERFINLESDPDNPCPADNNNFNDTEGITYISGNQFAIIEEREARVNFVNITSTTTNINYSSNNYVQLQINGSNPQCLNSVGLEGIAYNGTDNEMYTVRQSGPPTVYSFDIPAGNNGTADLTAIANLTNIIPQITIKSVHGIHFDNTNKNILVIATIEDGVVGDDADNQRVIIEITPCGDYVDHLELEAQSYFSVDEPNNVEGITMKNGDIILIGEGPTDTSPSIRFCLSKNPPPSCDAPISSNETNITNSNVTVNWAAVSGASTYQVQYKRTSDPSWTTAVSATGQTSRTITGLNPSTNYQWRVRTTCTNGLTSSYRTDSFTTNANPTCDVPTSSSETNITDSSVTLNWGAVSGVSTYRLQYKKTTDANWITADAAITVTTRTLTGLDASTNYQWRVRASCTNGAISTYRSDTFTTIATPTCNAPTSSNETNITDSSVTVNWGAVSGANFYRVEYKRTVDANWTTAIAATSQTSRSITGLNASTNYQWRVRTTCTNGLSSSYRTDAFTTTATPTCSAPTSSNETNITHSSVTLNWGAVSGASAYRVQYKRTIDANWITVAASTTATSLSVSGLNASTNYQWRVRTTCTNGVISSYKTDAFTTIATPTCSAPTSSNETNITDSSVTLNWGAVSGASAYRVQFKRTIDANWVTVAASTTATSLSVSGLNASTNYQWRVRTTCTNGVTSAYRTDAFVTTATPTCSAPTSSNETNITDSSVTVSWNAVPSVSSYRVQYRIATDPSWTTVAASTTATSLSITGLNASTNYQWRVRTTCINGVISTYRTDAFATTAPATCTTPTNVTITNVSFNGATISWSGNEPEYEVQYRTCGSTAWNSFGATVGNSLTPDALPASTDYEIRVRALCPGVQSSFVTRAFTTTAATTCNPASNPIVCQTTTSSAEVAWSPQTNEGTFWEVDYKLPTDLCWTSAATNIPEATLSTTISGGLQANTTYDWRVRKDCPSDYIYSTFFTGNCAMPTSSNMSNIGQNTARINWTTTEPNGTGYRIEYKLVGASSWTLANANNTLLFIVLNGLQSDAQYEYRIKSNCTNGGHSGYLTGNFSTGTIVTAPTCLPTNWNFMEIEAKWQSDAATYNAIVGDFPENGSWEGYALNVRWGGVSRRYIDVYYDNAGSELTNGLHSVRHRTRSECNNCNNSLSSLQNGSWSYQWEKVQYKSNPSRYDAVWFREEQGDCELIGECSCGNEATIMAGGCTHEATDRLLEDHPLFDFSTNAPISTVTQYRYRVELIKNGIVEYELSLDRVDEGNGNITYENELELTVPQGSRTIAQLDELFRLTSLLEANQNYNLTPSTISKGGTPVNPQSVGDADGDGICDAADNCPNDMNADQANNDGDYHGNACDNCIEKKNNDQLDSNSDGIGDICEPACIPLSTLFATCESFESDLGPFVQATDDDFNWTRKMGSTGSSSTGPSGAVDGNYYLYVESSSPNHPTKVARLKTACMTIDETNLSFKYHMYGSSMGSLVVNIVINNQATPVFSESGNQGDNWLTANINLSSYQGIDASFEFIATTANSYRSDISIDQICAGAPVCDPPTGLSNISVTANAAVVAWTAASTAISTAVEYKKSSDTNWTVANSGTTAPQVGIQNLLPNTAYDWRVRSICGTDYSTWVPLSFTTTASNPCNPINSVFPQCESFETNIGAFTQSTDDDTNWTRKTGSTPSGNTGPTSAIDGSYYMYIESSSPQYPGKVASLVSDCIILDDPNKSTLKFSYHMYGSNMGSLQVNVIKASNNNVTEVFLISGDQGNNWKDASIDLSSYLNDEISIEFKGTTGNFYRSDIAIDNICFTYIPNCDAPSNLNEINITQNSATLRWTKSSDADVTIVQYRKVGNPTYTTATNGTAGSQVNIANLMPDTDYEWYAISLCGGTLSTEIYESFRTQAGVCLNASAVFAQCQSFESGLDIFSQATNDNINWTRKSGSTSSSSTGPTGAYDGSFYMYIESSSPNFGGKVARLESDCFKLDDANKTTLNFRYHMYGSSMGSLDVNIIANGNTTNVFSKSGNQGNSWLEANIDLSSYLDQDIVIEFVGTTGTSYRSDISIDQVCITGNGCIAATNSIDLPSYGSSELLISTSVSQVSGVTGHDNGNVFVINDNAQRIIQYDPSGNIVGESNLFGFQDTEAIAYMGNNEFAIAEETRSRVVYVTINASNMPATISYPSSNKYMTMNVGGMEGIAYDRNTTTLYVSRQNSKEIYKIAIGTIRSGTINPDLIDVSGITSPLVHGLEFLPNGNLLVLGSNAAIASADKTLFEIDLCGNQISKKDINSLPSTPDGTSVSAAKMDGIAIGTDGCVYGAIDLTPGKLYKLCTQSSAGGITDCSRNSGIETTCAYNESFDGGFGAWINPSGNDIDWRRRSLRTPSSGTGPSAPSNGSHYLYVESSSSGIGFPNKTAYLESPCYQIPAQGHAGLFIDFDYHMYGSTMGTLSVEFTTDDVNWTSIWSESGNQGDQWNSKFLTLPASFNGQTVRLRFKAVTGASFRSDIAIDHIQSGCILVARQVETREQPNNLIATDLRVYPNPVQDYLTIEYQSASADKIDMQLINSMGQIIKNESHSKSASLFQKQINVSDLANGIYHVRIKEGDQLSSTRFVVAK